MVDDGEPYLLPLNFGYAVKAVRSRSSATAHAKAVSSTFCAKSIVAFEMDCRGALDEHDVACHCGYYFASVTGVGHVEFLDGEEKLAALTSLMRHMAAVKINSPSSRPTRSRSLPSAPTSSAPRQRCRTVRSSHG